MRRLLPVVGLVALIVTLALLSWVARATPQVRERLIAAINERFDGRVDLRDLQVAMYPRPALTGSGLRVALDAGPEAHPLLDVDRFAASASLPGLLGRSLHLKTVDVEGLTIRIPPGGLRATGEQTRLSPGGLVIDAITSRRALLEIASRKPDRLPRRFEIENLVMRHFGPDTGATFTTALSNPVPKGRIDTNGTFGPWNGPDPAQTPITGRYTFSNADLDVIKGLGGTLSSTGTYRGVLERVEVEGETDTPDFSIDVAGQPVPLHTRFTAVVDGTNGDTWLERVEATLAQSTIVARGEVVRAKNVAGRRVALDLHVDRARIEDLMRLAVNTARTPLVGQVDVTARFLLPAGDADVVDRLQLDGRFTLAQATFTSLDVQRRINLLSRRGRGDEQADGTGQSVVSDLRGRFSLRHGRLAFSDLRFSVPGAAVELTGTYDLHGEAMAFTGYLLADASLSDMTSGMKSMVARLAQPFFRRDGGGSRIPIRITGTRAKPTFGLDVRRVFRRR